MRSLYDTPAQAEFINTYVPIQFESLYRMADKAEERSEKSQAELDYLSSVRSLGSMSETANKQWDELFGQRVSGFIDENITDVHDLARPEMLAKLRGLKREITSDPRAAALMESKQGYKETAAKVDPRWGDYYNRMISSHDPTTDGVWSKNPLDFTNFNQLADELTRDVGAAKLGSSPDGVTGYYGISASDLKATVASNLPQVLSNPSAVQTAKYMLEDMGIYEGDAVTTEDGEEIPYDTALRSFIADTLMASVIPKTTKVDEKTNQAAIHYQRQAQQLMIHREKLSADQAKDQENKLNGLTGNWIDNALAESTQKKFGQIYSGISDAYIQAAVNNLPQEEADKLAAGVMGEAALRMYKSDEAIKNLSAEKTSLIEERSRVIASGGNPSEISSAINGLDTEIRRENDKKQYHIEAVNTNMAKELDLARSGRSRVFSKDEAAAFDKVPVPSVIADTWASMTFGEKIELPNIRGIKTHGYPVHSTSRFNLELDMPSGDLSGYKFGTSKVPASKETLSASRKLQTAIKDGLGLNEAIFVSSNQAILRGGGTALEGELMIPISTLMNTLGMTSAELDRLVAMPGISKSTGKPLTTSQTVSALQAAEGETINKLAIPPEYIKVPVSHAFLSTDADDPTRIVLDSEIEKEYGSTRRNTLSTYEDEPVDY